MNALEIKNLSVSFLMYDKGIKKKALKVISDLSISISPVKFTPSSAQAAPVRVCLRTRCSEYCRKTPLPRAR